MKKILLVEDDFSYMKLLHDRLTEQGYRIIEAIDGEKGLEIAKLKHPDLIILDVKMPVMNGIAMLYELRKDMYGKLIAVIILTNLDPDDKKLQAVLKDPSTHYLLKSDIQLKELVKKINDLI